MASMTALIADDSRSARDQLTRALSHSGFSVTECDNGDDALRLATSQHFDIVMVDVYLPKLDGIALIKKLRQLADYISTPMLAVANNKANGKKEAMREAGASGLIRLPIKPVDLQAVLKKLLPN